MPIETDHSYAAPRIIIIDDEVHCIDTLCSMLKRKYGDQLTDIRSSSSVTEARELIIQSKPELVFLDVEMPHQTGFDLLKSFDHIDFDVIFTTAYENYAINAIKFNALDYLLKPFGMDDLEKSMEKFWSKRDSTSPISDPKMNVFLSNLKLQTAQKKISLPTSGELIFVPLEEIIRCEANDDQSVVYFTDGSNRLVSRKLKEFEYMLEDMNFLRVNYDHLINLQHISALARGQSLITMSDGSQVEISKRKREEILKKLTSS